MWISTSTSTGGAEGEGEGEAEGEQFPVRLSNSQLKGKQALLTVCPRTLPKKAGVYIASWKIDGMVLASQRIKAISKTRFVKSLRISDTRLVVQMLTGEVRVARKMPAQEEPAVARIGPCFLVSSSEAGMAGLCPLAVSAQLSGGAQSAVLLEQELLVTDGPAPFVPGTLDALDVQAMTAFELRAGSRLLGSLPLTAAPVASFNTEGGFAGQPTYSWSTAAEDQLQEKLASLLASPRNKR